MHDTGSLGLVHWDDPEGWYGEGGRREVQDGEHVYTGLLDSEGEGEGGMIWENGLLTCILSCKN